MPSKKELCNGSKVQAAIKSVADAIISEFRAGSPKEFAFIGIHKQGVPMARRLMNEIKAQTGYEPPLALLDISMYRDDIGMRNSLPVINETKIPFDVNSVPVILVDDVLSTGRTIRAALDAVTDYGRPPLIRLAVLVDRGNHEFPISADYAGVAVKVGEGKKVIVEFAEAEGTDGIYEIEWKKNSRGG